MTVLLVLSLILVFVGLDLGFGVASRRAAASRDVLPLKEALQDEVPRARLVSPYAPEAASSVGDCRIPPGSFLSDDHAWVRIEPGGEVRIGIDDFAQKAVGPVNRVEMPRPGQDYHRGEPLFALQCGTNVMRFPAPVSGRVVEDNDDLTRDGACLNASPYVEGWICRLEPLNLASELPALRIGQPAVVWCDEEIKRYMAKGMGFVSEKGKVGAGRT